MSKIIDKIFAKKKPVENGVPTVPLSSIEKVDISPSQLQEPGSPINPQLITGCAQSVGMQRDHNEDALFSFTANLAVKGKWIPIGLFIVADGMGGHSEGEVASELAVKIVSSLLIKKIILPLLTPGTPPPVESIQEIMQTSAQEAHMAIIRLSPGSGTTLTTLLILDEQMTIAHVGDSRAYILPREGNLRAITRDHSLVMRMIELGHLTQEEAAVHPQRNVLYRALGQGDPFLPDIDTTPLPDFGQILLCSDGLWGVVPDQELANIISNTPNPQVACQKLIDAANNAGGPDNISVILIKIPYQSRHEE